MQRLPSNKKRATVRLSSLLEKKLTAYAAAASAAGVGILACSLPAEGKVVSTLSWTQIVPNSQVNLDLNNDGIPDFQFSNRTYATSRHGTRYWALSVLPQGGSNAIWGTNGNASALGSGVSIGPNGKLQPGNKFMATARYYCYSSCSHGSRGPWVQATRKFLGFRFVIQGEVHYGWARLIVTATDKGVFAAVTKYAYETDPNTPIVTGEGGPAKKSTHPLRQSRPASLKAAPSLPGSLGNLAAGTTGRK